MNIYLGILAGAATAIATSAAVAATSTVDFPTGFFTSAGSQLADPYYLDQNEDWGWTHSAITDPFLTASLNISALDVDFDSGELDEIFASDNGTLVSLGFLSGASDVFSFTEFVLGANFFDDIATGLEIFMNIDKNDAGWLVSLSKSVITTDGSDPGNPNPGVIPLPASGFLLLGGLAGMAALRRRRQKA